MEPLEPPLDPPLYGLRALHCLIGQGGWEMRIDITLTNGMKIFLQNERFKVASAKDKYRMTYSGFQETTTDPMAIHNETNFTTKDSDNESHVRINYANSRFQGTTTDPMVIHNEMNFPLKTCNDNDSHVRINYTKDTSWGTTGGWWYKNCAQLQLNTVYDHTHAISLNSETTKSSSYSPPVPTVLKSTDPSCLLCIMFGITNQVPFFSTAYTCIDLHDLSQVGLYMIHINSYSENLQVHSLRHMCVINKLIYIIRHSTG